jgi:hypothetical protein
MLEKNFETNQKTLDLFPIAGKKIELSYTGEQISSDGGLLLLREVENQTGLISGISCCITDTRDLIRMGRYLLDAFVSSYTSAPGVIVIDCDDTNNNTYSGQQLTLFNNYYHGHCYMPLHIYEGLSGKL